MKKILKKYLPEKLKVFIRQYRNNKSLNNYFHSAYPKNALLSYITEPFKKNSFSHTNFFEAQSWAKILNQLEYNVDIIDYRNTRKLNLEKYDLICGFGDIFQQYFESSIQKKIITIYYGTGMHVCHQNTITLKRVQDVYSTKNIWIGKSARFVEKTWTHQTMLVDAIIALGNDVCAESYRKYYEKNVYSLAAPFYKTQNANDIIIERKEDSTKHYLWFGSSGLIHKGLDLVLNYFRKNEDIHLHICGPVANEPEFMLAYKKELFESKNITIHGFIDIKSDTFRNILQSCSFIIYPSCSEGGSPSILTAIGNGGLIPIITKETTIDTGFEIWIDGFDYDSIEKAVKKSQNLSFEEIKNLQYKNFEFVIQNHSEERYYINLKEVICRIINAM